MRGLLKTSSTFGFACLGALLGASAFVLAANWGGKPPINVNAGPSPADVVASRFPFDWNEATATPAPAAVVKASYSGVAGQQALLSPRPTYQLASATVDHLPAMAYAPETTTVVPRVERAPAASATPAAAPARAAPEAKAAPAKPAARESRQVLNSAQIASIKKRLGLTPEQERYWPAVEASLRQMAWKKSDKKGEAKVVDMSTVDVDGLKSAAFPLVMSFNDEQKRELRSLAHLLGLDSVASRF
jgi:hypothetical protein